MSNSGQFEPLPEARFKIEFVDGMEAITFHASRNWFSILFIGVWLTIWTFGGFAAFFYEFSTFLALDPLVATQSLA